MVNHWTIIVRILYIWYRTQTACVVGERMFLILLILKMVCGREAYFLQNYLNSYLDGLSDLLNSLPVGCNIGGTVINHLVYIKMMLF